METESQNEKDNNAASELQTIVLKTPDGFKASTAVESAKAVSPVKPPRVAFPFEEIR